MCQAIIWLRKINSDWWAAKKVCWAPELLDFSNWESPIKTQSGSEARTNDVRHRRHAEGDEQRVVPSGVALGRVQLKGPRNAGGLLVESNMWKGFDGRGFK